MPTTPIYSLPYQDVNDPPNGPALGEDLAEAVETELVRIDGDIDDLPRGLIKWGQRSTASSTTTAADAGVLRVDSVSLLTGRQYRIWTTPLHLDSSVANDESRARIRYNTGGTATTASTILPGTTVHARQVDANVSESHPISTTYTPAGNETVSFLLCVGRIAGSGNVRLSNSDGDETIQLVIEDIGPALAQSGTSI